jgi:hypothetical protein
MSRFEFIFVLISIVAGFALTQLLSGLTRTFRHTVRNVDIAHVLFTLGTIALLHGVWWSSFRWEEHETWTFLEYSLIFVLMSMFYVMAEILHPRNSTAVPQFDEIRFPFYVVLIFYTSFEPMLVYVRDGNFSWNYLPMIISIIALAALGLFLRNRRFDQIFAAWNLFINNIAFQFVDRLVG